MGAGATGSAEPKLIAKGPVEKKKLEASARRGVRREKTPSATKLAAITMILVVRIELFLIGLTLRTGKPFPQVRRSVRASGF